jgi:UDP-N-acetyl-alpha-D-muramoyl-L-alanyl-L-glutamate epimerase
MTEATFDRDAIASFRFVASRLDCETGAVALEYRFDDGPILVERLRIPGAPFTVDGPRALAAGHALDLLHWIAGVSYYKAAVPKQMVFESDQPSAQARGLLREVYRLGLSEFAHRNGIDLDARLHFPVPGPAPSAAPRLGLPRRALVAIGGGKDSLVSIEALRTAQVEQQLAFVGGSQLIAACAERSGLPSLRIERQIAPELFEMNRRGAYNGHIPVTAINSAILVLTALLNGFDQVVFSNERSASYGSKIEGSGEVNHQWSKGWQFEHDFARLVHDEVAADLKYFSLLRPYSELAIARQFARIEGYDRHFSSCNRNFHLLGERPAERWCGVCPKCHFVFLALAPFMPKPRLVSIFGRNLLDEPQLAPGFDALIEYREHKPFECVGEAIESRAAFAHLAASPAWREDALVARFHEEILPQLDASTLALEDQLKPSGPHGIPKHLADFLNAHFGA